MSEALWFVVVNVAVSVLTDTVLPRAVIEINMTSSLEVSRIDHEDIVVAIAFSSDGRYFAIAGLDATARVWEMTSGLEVSRVYHEDMILAIAFSADGRYLATASEDSTAQVWQTETGRRVACLPHEDGVNYVAFSPDSNHLLTVTGSKVFPQPLDHQRTAIVWNITTGQKAIHITHEHGVSAVAFSADGRYLAIASLDGTVAVWRAIINQRFIYLDCEDEVGSHVAVQLNSIHMPGVSCNQSGWVWKANTSLAVARMRHDYPVVAMTFRPSGRHLATAGLDWTARVWEVVSGREIARMTHEKEVNSVAFSPDEKYLATASDDHTARVWEVTSAQEIARLTFKDSVNAVAFSPDGKLLATASGDIVSKSQDHSVRLWLWQRPYILTR